MFKLTGILILSLLIFLFVYRNSFKEYMTLLFLKDTISVLQYAAMELNSGMTYPQIFENNTTFFYKNFSFKDKGNFFSEIISNRYADKKVIEDTDIIFAQLGTHSLEDEKQYIHQNLEYLNYIYGNYSAHYNRNNKSNLLAGISAGIILFIVLI